MRKTLAAAAVVAAILGGGAAASSAQAQPIYGADPYLQPAQVGLYFWGGRHYCWYYDGWNGPGYYWCGYPWRRGFGWGGGYGWHGWSGGHGVRGGGFPGGPGGGFPWWRR